MTLLGQKRLIFKDAIIFWLALPNFLGGIPVNDSLD